MKHTVIYDFEDECGKACLSETFDTEEEARTFISTHKDRWDMSNFSLQDNGDEREEAEATTGYKWEGMRKVSLEEALASKVQVYRLYDDDSEAAESDPEEMRKHVEEYGGELGVEIADEGVLLQAENHEKATAKETENRTALKLTYIARDGWDRPVYKDKMGKLYVDVNPISSHAPSLHTKSSNAFDGEPDCPIYDTGIEFIPSRDTWR